MLQILLELTGMFFVLDIIIVFLLLLSLFHFINMIIIEHFKISSKVPRNL